MDSTYKYTLFLTIFELFKKTGIPKDKAMVELEDVLFEIADPEMLKEALRDAYEPSGVVERNSFNHTDK